MSANILIAVIDGLRASALGAYGNTTFPTPALDRFAAESLLLDWCFAPAVDLDEIYQALWHGLGTDAHSHPRPADVRQLLATLDCRTTLVSRASLRPSFEAAFDEVVNPGMSVHEEPISDHADHLSKTEAAQDFAALIEHLNRGASSRHLIWFHSRGMYGPWDAPLTIQQSLLSDDDLAPIATVRPPDLHLAPDDEPDLAFRYACAYAAQTIVLDSCWSGLLAAMDDPPGSSWLVMLLGARGFPLGEHGRIGGVDPRTYVEQVHVPWLVRFPNKLGMLARSNKLVAHVDLLPTLIEAIRGPVASNEPTPSGTSIVPLASTASTTWREAIVSSSGTSHSIRTASWTLREELASNAASTKNQHGSLPELYVRPDDRWETNDVAKLCPDIVEELHAGLSDSLATDSESDVTP